MSHHVGRAGGGRAVLERVPALDGLRGLAVAVVLVFHAGKLTGGYLGVDLFFTLSGYLITSLLVLEWRRNGHIALGAFWGRRVRRLLPALVVMLVAVGLVAQSRVLPAARGDLRDAGLATLAYVANWQAILGNNGYWDQTVTPSWLEHTWSLAIEEQFYLFWPLVVVAVLAAGRRRRPERPVASRERKVRLLGTVALGLGLVSATVMIVGSLAGISLERLYLGTDTRVAAILLGAAAACFQRARGEVAVSGERARRRLAVGAVAALAFLAVMWATLSGTSDMLYRGGLLACGVAAVVVILDITTPGASLVGRVLALSPLRALGAISYGLYLYHWPIYRFLGESDLGLSGWALVVTRIVVSLVVATVSFRFVEQPILQRRWSWPAVRLAPIGIAAAVIALLVGSVGAVDSAPKVDAEVTRPDVEALGPRVAAERVAVPAEEQAAAASGAPEVTVERLVDPVVLFVGDSVPVSLAEAGFVPQQDDLGLTVVNGAVVGCNITRDSDAPLPDTAKFVTDCRPSWPALVEEYRPDVVVFQFGAFPGVVPTPIDGVDRWPCTPEYDARWTERVTSAVDVLSSTGAVVNLVTAPTTIIPPDDKALFDERLGCVNDVLRDVADERAGVQLIDLAEWVCPDNDCRANIDGVDLRNDGLHYQGAGAIVTARWMAPQILEVEVDP